MRSFTIRALAVLGLVLFCISADCQKQPAHTAARSCCDLVAHALKDYSSIKEGSKRSEVERYFAESGGLSFGNQIAYVYKKCRYIRVIITYGPATKTPDSDVVASISKLSIEYEPKD